METSDTIVQPSVATPLNVFPEVEPSFIEHLGLVAAAIDSMRLVERIDKRLPSPEKKDRKVSYGQRVKAMIINGLGYTTAPLYITPQFFETKDVERLIGPGIEAKDLNDYSLGRALDAIFTYGTTQLFAEIAFEVAQERGLFGESVHIDTTTLLLHGEFAAAAELASKMKDVPAELAGKLHDIPNPALGHSKAHRHDLKQIVMSLTVTGPASMPLWFESLSGNSSDKTNFHDSILKFETFKNSIGMAEAFLWVADSALYAKGKLRSSLVKWLTRIPQTKKNAKALVNLPELDIPWGEECCNGYRTAVYNAIEPDEKWVLVSSKQAYKKELITFNKRIGKTLEKAQKSLRKVCKVVYHCEKDALKAGKQWLKTLKYHTAAFSTECIEHYKKAGKPPKDAKPDWIEYKLSGQITDDIEKQTIRRSQLGRFILGTNDVDNAELTAEVMLSTYCVEQQKVERGFRFLKSDECHLDSIYLKLPSRIDALMMIMTLTLMVYNATEYQMREAMKAQEITLPNQKGKQVARPTLRWVFQMMRGIHSLKSPGWADKVAGKTEVIKKIIRLFGAEACSIYDVEA